MLQNGPIPAERARKSQQFTHHSGPNVKVSDICKVAQENNISVLLHSHLSKSCRLRFLEDSPKARDQERSNESLNLH